MNDKPKAVSPKRKKPQIELPHEFHFRASDRKVVCDWCGQIMNENALPGCPQSRGQRPAVSVDYAD
jgi:hypothetical protein